MCDCTLYNTMEVCVECEGQTSINCEWMVKWLSAGDTGVLKLSNTLSGWSGTDQVD